MESFKGYDEATDCGGNCFGEGEYQIFLGNGNSNLQKPLIILDGFDPGDTRKIDNGKGSIVYLINNNDKELNMEKFKAAGFDVVILNFPQYKIKAENKSVFNPNTNQYITISTDIYRDGGADYIERNANVLKALINKLNTELQTNGSAEKLKIIGPSMGGLISRVALTQMEKANQNHNADIWVSFDSPHLGANIPIGLQYFFTFMEQDQVELLKSPAARQMLLIQNPPPITLSELGAQFGTNSFIYRLIAAELKKYPGNYTFRNNFKNLLNTLGFPNNTRNLALINGSINGTRQGTPKGLELDVDLNVLKTIFGSLFRYQIKTFATHDGGRHKIFERYRRIFFLRNTKSVYLVDNSGNGSLDNSPGGTFDMKNEFETVLGITLPLTNTNAGAAIDNLLREPDEPSNLGIRLMTPIILGAFGTTVYLNLNQGSPSFIPTKSSLAFSGTNKTWQENIGNRNLVCTGEIPFDNYFAPDKNEPHITLNSINMDWILKELNGNIQQPFFDSAKYILLSGDLAVCDTKTNIYDLNIPNTCSGYTITWTTSSNIQIQQSSNNSITVTPINGTNDAIGFINAYVQELNLNIHKKVWVGIPSPNFLSINKVGSYEFYANQWTKLKVVHPVPPIELMGNDPTYGLSYQWLVPNSQIRTFTDTSTIDVNPYSTGQLNIGLKMQNQCGCTNYQYQLFSVTSSSTTNPGSRGGVLTPIGKM